MTIVFCTAQSVLDYLGNATPLRLNESAAPELSESALNRRIINGADFLIEIFQEKFGFTLPTEEPDPLTNVWLLLELLNVESVVADTIRCLTGPIDPLLRNQFNTQRRFSDERLQAAERGVLNHAFLNALPTDALCGIEDVQLETRGLSIGATSKPVQSIVERWIARESSYCYALMARFGILTALTDEQQIVRASNPVATQVSALVLRYGSTAEYGVGLDSTVNDLITEAGQLYKRVETGKARLAA